FLQTVAELACELLERGPISDIELRFLRLRRGGCRKRDYFFCPACLRGGGRRAASLVVYFLPTRQGAGGERSTKRLVITVTVKHRQTRHLNRQPLVEIVDWPKQDDTAEGFTRCKCPGDLALWIEVESVGDINPGAVE